MISVSAGYGTEGSSTPTMVAEAGSGKITLVSREGKSPGFEEFFIDGKAQVLRAFCD
jgi:hypothetical protein